MDSLLGSCERQNDECSRVISKVSEWSRRSRGRVQIVSGGAPTPHPPPAKFPKQNASS